MAKKKKKRPALWFEKEPYESARRLEEEFHRMMQKFWARPFEFKVPEMKIRMPPEFLRTIPVDMASSNGELIIRASLPGFEKDEISLKVSEGAVEITAQKKREKITQKKEFYRREIGYGAARRVLALPVRVLPETARAKFEKGVLEIRVKKAVKKKKAKKVKVK